MTDKEKIKFWAKGRLFEIMNGIGKNDAKNILTDLLSLIDSMQTSVWHDANILPSDPNVIIVENNEYSTSICRAGQMSRVEGAKWAYLDDLLKL